MADIPELNKSLDTKRLDQPEHYNDEKTINGKRQVTELLTDLEAEPNKLSKKMKTDMNGLDHSVNNSTDATDTPDLKNPDGFQNGNNTENHSQINRLPQPLGNNDPISARKPLGDKENRVKKPCSEPHESVNQQQQQHRIPNHIYPGSNKTAAVNEDSQSKSESEPEVITLSDSEEEFKEVLSQARCLIMSDSKSFKLLKVHEDKLRCEENKLILLKKLRLSLSNSRSTEGGGKLVDSKHVSSGSSQRTGNIPPPLKRNPHQSSSNHSIGSSKALAQQNAISQSKSSSHGYQSNGGGGGSTGPPPLVNMAKTSSHQSGSTASQYSTPTSEHAKKSSHVVTTPQLTKEQKLTAAKLALKKQLEQSLLQIPAPKPLPPEVNFLPSLASGEFVYLIGMEEVVKYILSTDQKDVKYVFNPFSCVQCHTDFTPVWKRDKPGSKNVICEKCITSNQKKVLKQEHTTKLKAAFEKALQKEQDLEQRISAGSPLSDIPGLSALAAATAATQHQSSSLTSVSTPSMPQLTPQMTSSHLNSASPSQYSAAQLQQQALIQAQAAEQMRAMIAAQAMALPYQFYGVSNKQAADLQRQYLLDMINPNRSWKT